MAADIFVGSDAHAHDYLHEVLFRLIPVSWTIWWQQGSKA